MSKSSINPLDSFTRLPRPGTFDSEGSQIVFTAELNRVRDGVSGAINNPTQEELLAFWIDQNNQ